MLGDLRQPFHKEIKYQTFANDNANMFYLYLGCISIKWRIKVGIFFYSLPEGKAFLRWGISTLKDKIALEPENAALHASLASYHDLLQDTCSALDCLKIATKLDPQDKNTLWLYLKVQRSKFLEEKRTFMEERLVKCYPLKHAMPVQIRVSLCLQQINSKDNLQVLSLFRKASQTH